LDNGELERRVRDSKTTYPTKAIYYLNGIWAGQCLDCPFRNESPSVHLFKKTEKCCERCPYLLMIWLLDQEQLYIWDAIRPEEIKIREAEKAINEGKLDLVEEVIGRVPEVATPLFFIKIN
jgi:hypothetical protein